MHRIFLGYPPADHEVRNLLTNYGTEADSYRRACCFFDALFQHTLTLEREFDSQWGIEEVAHEFRIRMTAGQTMKKHNGFRTRFYQQVVQTAEQKYWAKYVCLFTWDISATKGPDIKGRHRLYRLLPQTR
jgi:hypothetical protein